MTEDVSVPQEDELEALKARATQMGIKFHPASKADSLKAKINEVLAGEPATPVGAPDEEPQVETENARRVRLKKEASSLVRCRITCMNPSKSEYDGEIITGGNALTGTVRKFIKFNVPFHVPKIILNILQAREYQAFYTEVDPRTRRKTRRGKLVKEFAIEMLPSLTEEQLKELAQRQAMAEGTADQ